MKKLLLSLSVLSIALLLIFSSDEVSACKRKKRKKQVAAADSVHVVRAPGVQNQHVLDSIKAAKMKEKEKSLKQSK